MGYIHGQLARSTESDLFTPALAPTMVSASVPNPKVNKTGLASGYTFDDCVALHCSDH